MAQVGFKGNVDDFFKFLNTDLQFFFHDKESLIAGTATAATRLPKLFETLPKATTRCAPSSRSGAVPPAGNTAASEDGSRPAFSTPTPMT